MSANRKKHTEVPSKVHSPTKCTLHQTANPNPTQPPAAAGPPTPTPSAPSYEPQRPTAAEATNPPASPEPPPAPAGVPPLDELAQRIKAEHHSITSLGRTTLERAREAGGLLNLAYAEVKKERKFVWDTWVQEQCGVKPRTANNYMRIASGWEQVTAAVDAGQVDWADLTVTDVLDLLKTGTRNKKATASEDEPAKPGPAAAGVAPEVDPGRADVAPAEGTPVPGEGGGGQVQHPPAVTPASGSKPAGGTGVRAEPAAPAGDSARRVAERLAPRSRADVEHACEHHGVPVEKLMALLADLGIEMLLVEDVRHLIVA